MNNRVNLSGHPLPLPPLFILTDFSKDSIKPDVVGFWPQIRVFDYFGHSHRHVGQRFKNISQSPLFTVLPQYLRVEGWVREVRGQEGGGGRKGLDRARLQPGYIQGQVLWVSL